MRTTVSLLLGAIGGALLVLCGCHQRALPKTAVTRQPGIGVAQARLVLPAVKGHPGVAYFTLGNGNKLAATLVRVDIVGACQTEMHETMGDTMAPLALVRIDPGQFLVFSPAGKHVMAFGIAPSLSPGGTSAITFHFQDGRITSAPLRIEAAGDGMSGMSGMGAKP